MADRAREMKRRGIHWFVGQPTATRPGTTIPAPGEHRIDREDVLAFVRSHGTAGVLATDVVRHFNAPRSTINGHLFRLFKDGLLTRKEDHRHPNSKSEFRYFGRFPLQLEEPKPWITKLPTARG